MRIELRREKRARVPGRCVEWGAINRRGRQVSSGKRGRAARASLHPWSIQLLGSF